MEDYDFRRDIYRRTCESRGVYKPNSDSGSRLRLGELQGYFNGIDVRTKEQMGFIAEREDLKEILSNEGF